MKTPAGFSVVRITNIYPFSGRSPDCALGTSRQATGCYQLQHLFQPFEQLLPLTAPTHLLLELVQVRLVNARWQQPLIREPRYPPNQCTTLLLSISRRSPRRPRVVKHPVSNWQQALHLGVWTAGRGHSTTYSGIWTAVCGTSTACATEGSCSTAPMPVERPTKAVTWTCCCSWRARSRSARRSDVPLHWWLPWLWKPVSCFPWSR